MGADQTPDPEQRIQEAQEAVAAAAQALTDAKIRLFRVLRGEAV